MSRYRLLVLATRHAIPPDSGYATDVFCAIEQLQKEDVDVRVILVDDGKAHPSAYPPSLLAGVVSMSSGRRWSSLGKAFMTGQPFVACKWSVPEVAVLARALHAQWPFDLVQAVGSFHMGNALAIKSSCGAKVVMRAANVEHIICQRMADSMRPGVRRAIWRREARLLRKVEGGWCQSADLCLPISQEDGQHLQALAPRTPMVVVQAGATLTGDEDSDAESRPEKRFIHLGNLDWAPRMEGLLWFLRDVWPLARQRIPGVRLSIAGIASQTARKQLRPWADQGVEVLGFVTDLDALARTCAAVIVPMRCGGGIKIRVLTAWSNGWPVVGTRLMTEGLPAVHEENCLVADEPGSLAEAMHRLCVDPPLRQTLVMAGRTVCRTQFSWQTIGRAMVAAHLTCLGRSSDA